LQFPVCIKDIFVCTALALSALWVSFLAFSDALYKFAFTLHYITSLALTAVSIGIKLTESGAQGLDKRTMLLWIWDKFL